MKETPIPKLVLSIDWQPSYSEGILIEDFESCLSKHQIEQRVDNIFHINREYLHNYVNQKLENRQEIIDYLCDALKDNIAVAEAKIKKQAEIDEKNKRDKELKELARLKKKYEKS